MAMNVEGLFAGVVSHALGLGMFERVNAHEATNAPGSGLTCEIFLDRVDPVRSSGLDSVSVRVSFFVRITSSLLTEPKDDIDPTLLRALDRLMAAYMGDFTIGGEARHVDVFGSDGPALLARFGYVKRDAGQVQRLVDITLPIIINDVWEEAA